MADERRQSDGHVVRLLTEIKTDVNEVKEKQNLTHTQLFGTHDGENEHGRLPRLEFARKEIQQQLRDHAESDTKRHNELKEEVSGLTGRVTSIETKIIMVTAGAAIIVGIIKELIALFLKH